MEAPADEQVKKHGATALLFLLLSLLAAGPTWGVSHSAAGHPGAKEAESRCGTAVQRASTEKSKPDQPQLLLDCVGSERAALETAGILAIPAAIDRSGEPAQPQRHPYQARAPPAG